MDIKLQNQHRLSPFTCKLEQGLPRNNFVGFSVYTDTYTVTGVRGGRDLLDQTFHLAESVFTTALSPLQLKTGGWSVPADGLVGLSQGAV